IHRAMRGVRLAVHGRGAAAVLLGAMPVAAQGEEGDGGVSDLHERLTAAVQHHLDRARRMQRLAQETHLEVSNPKNLGRWCPGWHAWPEIEQTSALLVQACESWLRVLDRHVPSPAAPGKNICWSCRRSGYMIASAWPCPEIRDLAYALGVDVGGDGDG